VTIAVAVIMIFAAAAAIALPLLRPPAAAEIAPDEATELHEREKHVALLAIREADFDRAMGKLSDDDHASLRQIYEERALGAMNALKADERATERTPRPSDTKSGRAAFCVRCGATFAEVDKFCSDCGSGRPRLVRS